MLPARNYDVLLASVAVLVFRPVYDAAVCLRCEATRKTGEVMEEKVVAADVEVKMMQLLYCPFHMIIWIGRQCYSSYLADTVDAPATGDMIGAAGVVLASIFVRFVLIGVGSRVKLSVPLICFIFFLGIRAFVI